MNDGKVTFEEVNEIILNTESPTGAFVGWICPRCNCGVRHDVEVCPNCVSLQALSYMSLSPQAIGISDEIKKKLGIIEE